MLPNDIKGIEKDEITTYSDVILKYDAILINQAIRTIQEHIKDIKKIVETLEILSMPVGDDENDHTQALEKKVAKIIEGERREMRNPLIIFLAGLTKELDALKKYEKDLNVPSEDIINHEHQIMPSEQVKSELLRKSVDYLNLDHRINKRFRRGGIQTIGDLLDYTERELLYGRKNEPYALKNFGEVSYRKVIARLSEIGLSLRKE